jgi:hypothetical protein
MSTSDIHLAMNQPRRKQALWRVVAGVCASWKWLAEFRNWNCYQNYVESLFFKRYV